MLLCIPPPTVMRIKCFQKMFVNAESFSILSKSSTRGWKGSSQCSLRWKGLLHVLRDERCLLQYERGLLRDERGLPCVLRDERGLFSALLAEIVFCYLFTHTLSGGFTCCFPFSFIFPDFFLHYVSRKFYLSLSDCKYKCFCC